MALLDLILLALTPEAPLAPEYLANPDTGFEERDPQYTDCIRLIAKDAEIGRIGAQQWVVEGGGAPAQHCLAVADLAAGLPRLAAVRLDQLAQRTDAGDVVTRALVQSEAALAWLDANEPKFAEEAITRAMAAAPSLSDIKIVAAKVYAENEAWQKAIDVVDAAEEEGVTTVETFIIRARAKRSLLKNRDAADDVVAALRMDPFNLDALVLRGELIQAGIEIDANYKPVN